MPSIRDLKARIGSVKSTKQITKAMKLVASSKVQKAKSMVESNRKYFKNLKEAIIEVLSDDDPVMSNYFKKVAKDDRRLYIIVSSDKGLCGGYNINNFKELMSHLDSSKDNRFIISGKKAREFLKRKGYAALHELRGISEDPLYQDAATIGKIANEMLLKDEIDEIYIIYSKFISILTQEATCYKVFPLDIHVSEEEKKKSRALTLFEPDKKEVLDYIIPKYINSIIYGALLEGAAGQESARMTAMDNASNNADEIVDDLTLIYNRERQAGITKEISEIVGGANALNA